MSFFDSKSFCNVEYFLEHTKQIATLVSMKLHSIFLDDVIQAFARKQQHFLLNPGRLCGVVIKGSMPSRIGLIAHFPTFAKRKMCWNEGSEKRLNLN